MVDANRRAWDVANRKYLDEPDRFVSGTLLDVERVVLAPLLRGATVVHLQSGNGTDDIDLAVLGAGLVVGVDFSATAAAGAARRTPAAYVVADVLAAPLRAGCADVVYTGKGALPWLGSVERWATEVGRLLRPGGHLFLYEEHPMAPLFDRSPDVPRVVAGRSYFGGTRANDTFPASALGRFAPGEGLVATEHQWPLGAVVSAVAGAGLLILRLDEHLEPFWRPDDAAEVAAWRGDLPNAYLLLARRS